MLGLVNDWVGIWMEHGTVAGEGYTSEGGGTRAKDLAEVGCSAEVDGGGTLLIPSPLLPIANHSILVPTPM